MGVPLYFKTILEQYNNILISQNNDIKKSNLFLYKVIKYTVNLSLLVLLISFIYFSVNFISEIIF